MKKQKQMKKLNANTIRFLLIISLSLNILFFVGYGVRMTFLRKYQIEYGVHKTFWKWQYNREFNKLPNDTSGVVMLGNSLTYGFEWKNLFKNVNIKNRGVGGNTTKDVLHRLNKVIESNPKKIFIEIGINDLLGGYSVDTVFDNYTKIVQIIKQNNPTTRIYIQSILPTVWNIYNTDEPVIKSTYILNKKLKDYCDSDNMTYIDLFPKFLKNQGLNSTYDSGDKLHLNWKGYLLWCSLIKYYINE
jgi:lysophospholipase L1-like esterase